ncbi:MAG: metallopeptidase TldD-related protein [candidate division WOR-3 bacterium]
MDTGRICDRLNRTEGITHWLLQHSRTDSTTIIHLPTLYGIRQGQVFSAANPYPREVITSPAETATLTLFARFTADGKEWLGDATGQVTDDSETGLDSLIRNLLANCRTQQNPPFPLPGADEPYHLVELADRTILDLLPQTLLERAQEFSQGILAAARKYTDIAVSNIELFFTRTHVTTMTSAGVRLEYPATRLGAEICLLCRTAAGNAGEHTERLTVRRLADLDPQAIVAEAAPIARQLALASSAPSHRGKVVLLGEAAADFLLIANTPLAFHASARTVYEKSSRYSAGAAVSGETELKGEPLNISSDPTIDFGLASSIVAPADGSACRPATLVRDGYWADLLGTRRYFSYLGLLEKGVLPPGTVGNTVVPAGNTPLDAFLDQDCVVVRTFSGFSLDRTSGQFAVEIRLGELRQNGKSTPFHGGLLVGNWFSAIADAFYSRELQTRNDFYGPKAILFGNLQTAG